MKKKYLKLLNKLIGKGWLSGMDYKGHRDGDIEAVTHEIAHIITIGNSPYDIEWAKPTLVQNWVNTLIEDSLDHAMMDKNEFLVSAVTQDVLHRLGITDLDENTVFFNLCINLQDTKYYRRKDKIRREYQRIMKTMSGTIEETADEIMAYYHEVLAE